MDIKINKKYIEKFIIVLSIIFLVNILYNDISNKLEHFGNDNNLIMIIPIRNREGHLKIILKNIIPIFNYQNINYKIYIIEQSDKKQFNKGKINNVGFIEATKDFPNYERILFNDVDNYPKYNKAINYKTYVKGFHHFFGDPRWLGGFFITNKYYFSKVNGFSNNYWGWGGEDNDLLARIDAHKINIIRNVFYKRFEQSIIVDIEHEREDKKKRYQDYIPKLKLNKLKYEKDKKYIEQDGINTCEYKILKKTHLTKNIVRILVDL